MTAKSNGGNFVRAQGTPAYLDAITEERDERPTIRGDRRRV